MIVETGKFLTKGEIPHPVVDEIRDLTRETIAGKEKYVLHFKTLKSLPLSQTNIRTLVESFGNDSERWKNKSVEIYIDPSVTFAGVKVGGIRINTKLK
jgi:hypothetical protein